jgi:HSP20 family molecular chaperone IbpA
MGSYRIDLIYAMTPKNPSQKDPPDPFDNRMFFLEELGELFETHRPYGRSETGFLAGRSFRPAANIYETPDGITIAVDLPGIDRDDIDLKIDEGRLIVSGKRDFKRDDPDEEFVRLERGFGSFRRIFEIPGEVDRDRITARLEQGVLTITVPRLRQRHGIIIKSEEDQE